MEETPYDRGYYDGENLLPFDYDYYAQLSEEEKNEYDLGFYDGDANRPHRDQKEA